MILQALNELYPRLAADPSYEIAPPGFSPQKISFRLVIRLDGSLVAIEDARTKNTKGAFEPTRLEVPQHEKRTSGVKAQFLCDKAEYLLGRQLEGQRAGFAEECFQACKEKHLTWESEIASPVYSVFCRFLEQWTPIRISEFPIIAQLGANFGVVQILGERGYVHDDVRTREWWTDHLLGSIKRSLSRCLITGDIASPSRIHPDIKGFKSSVALVGIQENTSYESYGWAKTENCPIGESAAFRYSTALNALLDGPQKSKHRINVAGTTTIFWTETPSELEDCFAGVLGQGSNAASDVQDIAQRAKIQRLLNAIRDGTRFRSSENPGRAFTSWGWNNRIRVGFPFVSSTAQRWLTC
jgi:CRISPR-associated protein Csd1